MIAKEDLRDIISVRREIVCNAMCKVDNLELEKEDILANYKDACI